MHLAILQETNNTKAPQNDKSFIAIQQFLKAFLVSNLFASVILFLYSADPLNSKTRMQMQQQLSKKKTDKSSDK